MTVSTSTTFEVVTTGQRRRVVSPSGRPDLHLISAHPQRPVAPGRVGKVASCTAAKPARREGSLAWLRVKVAVVGLLAIAGVGASAASFIDMAQPDPTREYVAGDPAWAHVTQP